MANKLHGERAPEMPRTGLREERDAVDEVARGVADVAGPGGGVAVGAEVVAEARAELRAAAAVERRVVVCRQPGNVLSASNRLSLRVSESQLGSTVACQKTALPAAPLGLL